MVSLKRTADDRLWPFQEQKLLSDCQECFLDESEKLSETGERFMRYFIEHASREGVLFKTIKEITQDLNIPHQTLTKVLKALEKEKMIYRRNGIIGLWNS